MEGAALLPSLLSSQAASWAPGSSPSPAHGWHQGLAGEETTRVASGKEGLPSHCPRVSLALLLPTALKLTLLNIMMFSHA